MKANRNLVVALAALAIWSGCDAWLAREPIKVGVLHSFTGTMAISERSVIDATLMAIAEVNERGGVLGRKLEPIVVDGKSSGEAFAIEAERLITKDKVSVVFGCWTSDSRKTAKPVFEKYNHLLFYPVQYEGLEQSPNIVYTGAAPNQQIIPAVEWCGQELHAKRFFLVGSDYVFPRTAHAIIRAQVGKQGGTVVGEDFVLLGSTDFKAVVGRIVSTKPDLILNCINGDGNLAFFEELRARGVQPTNTPTLSFSLAEDELRNLGAQQMAGDYCAWNYFQSLDTPENKEFVTAFKSRYGRKRVVDDPMEAAYCGVHLWAKAVKEAGSTEAAAVRKALVKQTLAAPEGMVAIDAATQHMHKKARIGKIRANEQFDIVWTSPQSLPPQPYPEFRTKTDWEKFLADLFEGWGRRWANPGLRKSNPEGVP